MNNLPNLEKILINDEGIELEVYPDTKGNWTIGVGYFIGKDLRKLSISLRIALEMMREKIDHSIDVAIHIFGIAQYELWLPARRDAILSLIFNMGEGNNLKGFRSFTKMIKAIAAENWIEASEQLKLSEWAKDVDPKQRPGEGRDDRLIFMLKTGEYHEKYKMPSDADH